MGTPVRAGYHAVVVDEGRDFEARWFELLQRLLVDPEDVVTS